MKNATRISTNAAFALAACFAAGCDSPAEVDGPREEALISVQGAMVVEGTTLEKDVVPVLAWYTGAEDDFSKFAVQEVAVSGDFPSKFELAVHEAPSEAVLAARPVVKGFESEPRFAYAHLAALPRKHDDVIYLGVDAFPNEANCTNEGENEVCTEQYCDYYGQCFTQTTVCPPLGVCSAESSGPTRVQNGLGVLSGFVSDYALVYLESEAKPGSLLAWQLGASKLEAGFHLVRLGSDDLAEPTPEDDAAAWECVSAAEELGTKRFEQAYDLPVEEVGDDSPEEEALATYIDAAAMEANCTAARVGVEVVELDQRVTMTLGDELVFVY